MRERFAARARVDEVATQRRQRGLEGEQVRIVIGDEENVWRLDASSPHDTRLEQLPRHHAELEHAGFRSTSQGRAASPDETRLTSRVCVHARCEFARVTFAHGVTALTHGIKLVVTLANRERQLLDTQVSPVHSVSGLLTTINLTTQQLPAAVDHPWLDLLRIDVTLADNSTQLVRTYGLFAPNFSASKY